MTQARRQMVSTSPDDGDRSTSLARRRSSPPFFSPLLLQSRWKFSSHRFQTLLCPCTVPIYSMMCGGGVNAPDSLALQSDQGLSVVPPDGTKVQVLVDTVMYRSNGCYTQKEKSNSVALLLTPALQILFQYTHGFVSAPSP